MKCVIVIDHALPLGLIANSAAVLAISIGDKMKGIVGPDVFDRDGQIHRGITRVSIPILKGDRDLVRSIRARLLDMADPAIFFVDFCDVAQSCRDYGQYTARLEQTPAGEIDYLGIALCGPDKTINSLTGSIGLLR